MFQTKITIEDHIDTFSSQATSSYFMEK